MNVLLKRFALLLGIAVNAICVDFAYAQSSKTTPRKLEADPQKSYEVNKKCGPWMIMVTSLRGNDTDSVTNANKAARELVIELRKKGIPAWIHSQQGELEEISSFDRNGNNVKRFVAAQRNRVCVLAGEYESVESQVAQDTLAWIQRFHPKALEKGAYRPTPGRPGPLSRAFLTLNPLFSEDEINEMALNKDPLLKQLNQDNDYNLKGNKHKYSLIVATFQGASKHVIATGQKQEKEAIFKFDSMLEKRVSLDNAGQQAWTLVRLLRGRGHEAYVFHERFRSIVTVAGIDDPNDPRVAKLVKEYGAKMKPDPKTKQEVLTPVIIQSDAGHLFLLDVEPKLIRVPRLK